MNLLVENDQSLIPLYVQKVVPKLTGQFRKSQGFRPLQIVSQIIALQVSFWGTVAVLQLLLITVPGAVLSLSMPALSKILLPSYELLFDLRLVSLNSIYPILNCFCFICSGYMRYLLHV